MGGKKQSRTLINVKVNNLLFDKDEHKEQWRKRGKKAEQRQWVCKGTGSIGGNSRCREQRETSRPAEGPGSLKNSKSEVMSIGGEKE